MCYKMLHGLVYIDCSMFFKLADSSVTRGHQFKLCKPLCPLLLLQALFGIVLLIHGMHCQQTLCLPHLWQRLKLV